MASSVISYGPEVNANAKTELVAFCQRKSASSMRQGDIVYTVEKWGAQYQATVKLNCLNGDEFAGELCATEKQAEQAAAHQALLAHAEELQTQQSLKRKAMEAASDPAKWARCTDEQFSLDEVPPDPSVKGKLHTAVKQLLCREVDNTDIVYEISATDEGMVASLTLPTLGLEIPQFHGKVWVGKPTMTKQGTRLSAAAQALAEIMARPEGMDVDLSQAKLPDPEAPRNKGVKKPGRSFAGKGQAARSMKGKGKGLGMGFDWVTMFNMMSMFFNAASDAKGGGKGAWDWDNTSSSTWSWKGDSWPRHKGGKGGARESIAQASMAGDRKGAGSWVSKRSQWESFRSQGGP